MNALQSQNSSVQPGNIYWVENKVAEGHEYRKRRPYLIIDKAEFIRRNSVVGAIPLTSQLSGRQPFDVLIQKSAENCLIADSLAKVGQIYSIDKSRLNQLIGRADEAIIKQIHQHLRRRFDF